MGDYLRLWLAETLARWAGRIEWSAAVDTLVEVTRESGDKARELEVYDALAARRRQRLRRNGRRA